MKTTLLRLWRIKVKRIYASWLYYFNRPAYYRLSQRERLASVYYRFPVADLTPELAELFTPVLSEEAYRQLFDLYSAVTRTLTQNRLTYCLSYGSLLGALLYRDTLPWDDDMDIFCWEEDRPAITKALQAQGLTIHDTPQYTGVWGFQGLLTKAYYPGKSIDKAHPWPWPFIDIAWLRKLDDTYCVDTSNGLCFYQQDFQSLEPIPFGSSQAFAPINAIKLLPEALDYAFTPGYNHVKEQRIATHTRRKIPIDQLAERFTILQETLPALRSQYSNLH